MPALAAVAILGATGASAQAVGEIDYHLPAQSLSQSIRDVAIRSRANIIGPASLVRGRQAPALVGHYSAAGALAVLLRGSGLDLQTSGRDLIIVPSGSKRAVTNDLSPVADDIVVTGSRIRGAPVASLVIRQTSDDLRDQGIRSLAEAVRHIPQSFGGGQNPGIGFNVPESSGADVGGGASVNLRGLGSDATLTLLNGHRLSYSAASQSVDVSAIPFGAVDRIEVVPDGASALFGSDAVGGVVNIILRRDFDGLETGARLSGSTDGGNFGQLYDVTGGKRWRSGGLLLAYEYGRSTPIVASDRSYAATRSPGLTLYPALRHHNGAASFHQQLAPNLTFSIDGLANKRWTEQIFPLNFAGDLSVSRGSSFTVATSFGVAPSLRLSLPRDWTVALTGSLGQDKVFYGGDYTFGTTSFDAGSGTYRNSARAIELSGDGRLLTLPGGSAKLALGTGYRRISFERTSSGGAKQDVARSQDDYYAFGELSLPLLGPDQQLPFIHKLDVSAAARVEDYPSVGRVLTPKFGIIYAPTRDFDLKASWGRSFRAPTLYQQYQPKSGYLIAAASLGGSAFPPGSNALLFVGGNPGLKPERSINWSATIDFHPHGVPGLSVDFSYFSVRYVNRIVTPILYLSRSLNNPLYADQLLLNPSAADQAAAIASAGTFTNITGGTSYNPAQVVAIVNNTNVNAGRQKIHGIDLLLSYERAIGAGHLAATLNATYLDSDQQLTSLQPIVRLAGTIFNPPHVRGRGALSWSEGELTITAGADYLGAVRDTRSTPSVRIAGMTPIDLSIRVRPRGQGWLGGLDLTASVQNLFNAKPSPIATSLFYDTPYDSTNYSPFGRVISLGIAKRW